MAKLSIVKVKLDREVSSYIVSDAGTKEAVVIDPGMPAEDRRAASGLTVKFILATHGHPGHVGGKDDLKALVGGETGIHSGDAKQFLRSADRYLAEGDELNVGEFKVTVMHTPGHTPRSVCFLIANHAFVGDTILAGGIGGRCRRPTCDGRWSASAPSSFGCRRRPRCTPAMGRRRASSARCSRIRSSGSGARV